MTEVDARLRCLSFRTGWAEASRRCSEDLRILAEGFKVVVAKLCSLRKLFKTFLRLGNMLNKNSSAAIAKRGFRLSSLQNVLQLRSTSKPSVTLLHVALALLDPAEVSQLTSGRLALSAARDRKSSG